MAAAGNQAMVEAAPADYANLAGVLVRAFWHDPFHQWLFPDQATRPASQRLLFDRVLAIYGRHGVVYTTPDKAGCAMWDPPRSGGPSLVELLGFVFRVLPVFGRRAFHIARGMAPMATLHPGEPHWYLSILGTDPARQKSGVGGSLLMPVLRRCDEDGTSAYLEASRIENVPYYQRFGFEVVAPLAMPEGGPVVYRMKREPRTRA
jgi:GNAT superfamily N-acetyltransferase